MSGVDMWGYSPIVHEEVSLVSNLYPEEHTRLEEFQNSARQNQRARRIDEIAYQAAGS